MTGIFKRLLGSLVIITHQQGCAQDENVAINWVPLEVKVHIFNYLNLQDNLNVKLVSHEFREISDYIFKPLDNLEEKVSSIYHNELFNFANCLQILDNLRQEVSHFDNQVTSPSLKHNYGTYLLNKVFTSPLVSSLREFSCHPQDAWDEAYLEENGIPLKWRSEGLPKELSHIVNNPFMMRKTWLHLALYRAFDHLECMGDWYLEKAKTDIEAKEQAFQNILSKICYVLNYHALDAKSFQILGTRDDLKLFLYQHRFSPEYSTIAHELSVRRQNGAGILLKEARRSVNDFQDFLRAAYLYNLALISSRFDHDLTVHGEAGTVFFQAGRYDLAIRSLRRCVELSQTAIFDVNQNDRKYNRLLVYAYYYAQDEANCLKTIQDILAREDRAEQDYTIAFKFFSKFEQLDAIIYYYTQGIIQNIKFSKKIHSLVKKANAKVAAMEIEASS